MDSKKSYLERTAQQLKEWDKDIESLRKKVAEATTSAKGEYQKQLDDIKTKRANLEEKFKALRNSSDEAWQDMKNGLEKSWSELKQAFDTARSKF
ncbi:MAG: coiled coil domain-containing protein [Caldithrix sp.]|nr:coiled coil domain-containing protein [Caldithrix sp.]